MERILDMDLQKKINHNAICGEIIPNLLVQLHCRPLNNYDTNISQIMAD